MQAIKITAQLYNGFTSSDPWSPSIDGILAYWHMREKLGDEFELSCSSSAAMRPVDDLPLERIDHDGLWWYACSSPIYCVRASARKHIHRRFDDVHERHLDLQGKSGKILTAAGPFKNTRLAFLLRVTDRVEWHVVGDHDAIARLLHRCSHIGSRYGAGFGRVRDWTFEPGDRDIALRHRPVPLSYAEAHGIEGEMMRWGIRPPARIAACSAMCVMPRGQE
jgi:CRISPR type IV-associated protein Csf3